MLLDVSNNQLYCRCFAFHCFSLLKIDLESTFTTLAAVLCLTAASSVALWPSDSAALHVNRYTFKSWFEIRYAKTVYQYIMLLGTEQQGGARGGGKMPRSPQENEINSFILLLFCLYLSLSCLPCPGMQLAFSNFLVKL